MTQEEKPSGILGGSGWSRSDPDTAHPEERAAWDAATDAATEPGAAAAAAVTPAVADTAAAEQLSSLMLMLLGLAGGIYLLYAWGWFVVAGQYNQINLLSAQAGGSIWVLLQTLLFWAAPLAPIVWFLTAVKVALRLPVLFMLLVGLGLVLLVPLPLFVTGGAGG